MIAGRPKAKLIFFIFIAVAGSLNPEIDRAAIRSVPERCLGRDVAVGSEMKRVE
jgi:hypothetical protein